MVEPEDAETPVDETCERLLAGIVRWRGGELRLPRHYLDSSTPLVEVTATVDPVTDDVVIRIRH